ncbi:MAG: type II toxin-antitoxin system VapC family toxin [Desulfobacteraceae bacterium]|nr:MAG: type II toxin-antitoxin system VapC family toxin [Desulfobacteraceae bacterium]
MGVILDTSVLIEAERGRLDIDGWIRGKEEEPFGLSVITVSELLHGVHRADSRKRRLKRSAYVERVIELFPVYPFDLAASRVYAQIWAELAGKGVHIGAHDLLIASTAVSLGFSVVSFNPRHFERIEGLEIQILYPAKS